MRVLVFTNMYPSERLPFYGSFVSDEVSSLRRAGVDVDVYFVNGREHKFSYAMMPFGFFSRVLRREYDVVHVHHSFCGFVATLQRRVPVVWTFHEGAMAAVDSERVDPRAIKRLAYSRRLKRWVATRANAVIAVSAHLRDLMGRPDADVIPCGIDLERFQPIDPAEAKRRLGLSPELRYVLFPSTPSRPEKRFALADAAMRRLRETAPEYRDVELMVLNEVPHESVPDFINGAEAVLMTSKFEASPITIREALACNVPVVSTAVGDVPAVLDGIRGCYVANDDPDSLAAALRAVLAGPRRVESRHRMMAYSIDLQTRALLDVYRRVQRVSATVLAKGAA